MYQFENVTDYDNITESSNQLEVASGFAFPDYFGWFRLTNDGTNIKFYISPEGVLFKQVYQELADSFLGTIDKVGFGFERATPTVTAFSSASAILWSWVES